jgi:gas vesicle protein
MYELQESTMDLARNKRPTTSFAVGALIGAGLALLLAPAAGRETRQRLGQRAKSIGTGARGALGRTRGALDRTRDTIRGFKNDAKSAVDAGRDTYERTRRPEEQHAGWRTETP